MLGYLDRPDETAEMVSADGWVRTGDLGYVTNDGSVVVVDRLKELIKVNAFQVPPAEVEAVLIEHPAVVDAAVVGQPDERTGETPVAYVVTSAPVSTDELAAWSAQRLAPYKRPTTFHTVDDLPELRRASCCDVSSAAGSRRSAQHVDELVAEGDGPSRAVSGNRPCPAVAAFHGSDHVGVAVVGDDVAGTELVSVDRRHHLQELRTAPLIHEAGRKPGSVTVTSSTSSTSSRGRPVLEYDDA